MKCLSVIVADADSDQLRRSTDQLSHMEGIDVIASTMYGDEVIRRICSSEVDVIVTDIVLKGIDGIGVLDAIGKMEKPRPKSLILTHLVNDDVMEKISERGASFLLPKPVDADLLYNRIRMFAGNRPASKQEKRTDAGADAGRMLKRMGVSPGMKGYTYLTEAIRLRVMHGNEFRRLSAELYPKIAEHFSTTPESVERAIRTAIGAAWKSGGIQKFLLENQSAGRAFEKPTAGSMIDMALKEISREKNLIN